MNLHDLLQELYTLDYRTQFSHEYVFLKLAPGSIMLTFAFQFSPFRLNVGECSLAIIGLMLVRK